MFACVDCHKDVKSLAHETARRRFAAQSATPTHRKPTRTAFTPARTKRRRAGSKLPGLPRRRARDSGRRRCQVAGESRQYSRHLRPVPRAEIPDGVERRKRSALHLLSGQRAWARRREGIDRRPRSAPIAMARTRFFPPTIPSRRSTSSMFRPPAASAIRQLKTPSCRAFTGRELRGATDWLRSARTATESTRSNRPVNPNSPVSEQNLSSDICARCHEGVRLSQEFGVPGNRVTTLLGQLSRTGRGGRLGGCGQLLQLPRRA